MINNNGNGPRRLWRRQTDWNNLQLYVLLCERAACWVQCEYRRWGVRTMGWIEWMVCNDNGSISFLWRLHYKATPVQSKLDGLFAMNFECQIWLLAFLLSFLLLLKLNFASMFFAKISVQCEVFRGTVCRIELNFRLVSGNWHRCRYIGSAAVVDVSNGVIELFLEATDRILLEDTNETGLEP